jgi:hypothetical protein
MASNEIETLGSAASVEKLNKIAAGRALNRRHFLAALGMTGAAAGAGLMSGCNATTTSVLTTTASTSETNVLNFALNLEYLEATFYSYITQGADLPTSLIAGSGSVTGTPSKLTFTGTNAQQTTDLLNEIYFDEMNHVAFLKSLLGSSAVPRPAINLAAYGTVTATNALSVARLFEDVGVTAYAAAVPLLSNSNITYASQILGVESFHAGALRLISIQNPTIAAYVKADSLDVAPFDNPAVIPPTGPTGNGAFFATYGSAAINTSAGMAYARTTSQVLAIVYGAPGAGAASGASSGGFFPSGANGTIKAV